MRLYVLSKKIVTALFEPECEEEIRYLTIIWLGTLYFLGIFLWGYFLGWRLVPLDYSDWGVITLPRLDAVRDALYYGQIPFHLKDVSSLHGIDRFFSLPDVITTPQMVLLRFISLQSFILIDVFIHYSIGFAGLFWFRRKYNLSLVGFSLLVGLFSFNGYILLHYIVGHFSWAGYFLFPTFFALMVKFIEESPSWKWVAQVSFLMFYMVLAGSEHHFLWLMLFLAALCIVEFRKIFWGFAAILFSGLVSAVRLLPPAFSTSAFYAMGMKGGIFSYPNLYSLFEMMLKYHIPGKNADYELPYIYWEYTLYIGIIGTIFLVVFGLLLGLWSSLKANKPGRTFRKFIIPTLFLLFLSFGKNYELLRSTGITIFYGERVVSRMIAVPFVVWVIFSAINFQSWLDKKPRFLYIPLLLTSFFVFYQLVDHIIVWQVNNAREAFGKVSFEQSLLGLSSSLAGNSINNHPDPVYFMVLGIGLGITLLASFFLLWQVRRNRLVALSSVEN